MWIRMSNEEIEKDRKERERKYKSLKWPLFCSLIAFLLMSVLTLTGYGNNIKNMMPLDVFLLHWLSDIFVVTFFLFLGLYAWQLIMKRPLFTFRPSLICPKCENVKLDDCKMSCKCGGKYEYLSEMKWVKDCKSADVKKHGA
ncbi:MAG: hypothetical protein PHX78_07050 [bacterium]|nr:hypothetical protein [bacterium]